MSLFTCIILTPVLRGDLESVISRSVNDMLYICCIYKSILCMVSLTVRQLLSVKNDYFKMTLVLKHQKTCHQDTKTHAQ